VNKKLVLSVLSTAVVTSMAASAMAKPNAGFYIGGEVDKYYSIDAFFNHFDEALDDIVSNLESTTFVDEQGYAAPFMVALEADDLSKVMEPARLDHFEKNPYAIVDGTGSYNPEEDEDLLPPVDGGELKVESVSAINAKTIAVNFNKELTDEEKAAVTFEVKKGGAVQLFKLDSYEGKVAKLVRTSGANLEAGTYEITVKGLKDGATNTGTVTVEAQKATTLEITGDVLTDATAKAKVAVELKDQYGDKLALNGSDFTVTAYNKTQNASVVVNFDSTDKYFYIDTATNADAFKLNDEINVVILHNATGLKATKTLKVAEPSNVATIEFGNIELPAGKSLLTEDLTNVKVPYTAKDQYGNDIKLGPSNTEVISSDPSVINKADVEFIEENNVTKIQIKKFGKAGKATITLFNKVTGDTSSITFDVHEKAGSIYGVEFESAAVDLPEGGSAVAVGLNITDKYGNKIEPAKYVDGSAFTINVSNSSVVSAAFDSTASSKNFGKLLVTPKGKKGQTATVTVTVNATGETATLNVTIGEAAVLSILEVDSSSTHNTSLIQGATTTVKFAVKDQYGNVTTSDDPAYSVSYEVKDASPNISLSKTSDNNESNASVVVKGEKVGSATLVAKLMNGATVVATKEITFSVAANSSDGLTYSIEDIADLYELGAKVDGDEADISADDVEAGYVKEIKIKAVDASGTSYAVPSSEIVGVTVSDSTNFIVGEVDGKWYVGGKADVSEAKTATVSVVFNTDDGVKTITKQVKVLPDALEATALEFKNAAPGSLKSEAVTKIKLANAAAYASDIAVDNKTYIWIKDQFGGYSLSNDADNYTLTFSGVDGLTNYEDDTIAFADPQDGSLTITDTDSNTTFTKANAKFRLVAYTANGLSDYIDVTVVDGVLPVTTSTVSAQDTIAAGDSITIKFDEAELASSTKDAIENAIKAQVAAGGATADDLEFKWNGSELTITNTNDTDAVTWADNATVTAADFKDAAGNEAASNVTIALKS